MASSRTSRSPTRRSSHSSTPQVHDSDEHPDTPLRKKARTDQGDLSPIRLPATPRPNPVHPPPSPESSPDPLHGDDKLPPPTPSKVTLNLRRSAAPPTFGDDAGTHALDSTMRHSVNRERLSPSSDTIEIAQPSPARSPEAIEISIDDDDEDRHVSPGISTSSTFTEDQIYARFPYAHRYGGAMFAVEAMLQDFQRVAPSVEPEFLLRLEEWLRLWIAHCQRNSSLCQAAFSGSNASFWLNLSSLFCKLLGKRFTFNPRLHVGSGFTRVLESLFVAWLEVCGTMFQHDVEAIQRVAETNSRPVSSLISQRATVYTARLLSQQTTLWLHLLEQGILEIDEIFANIITTAFANAHLHIIPLQKLTAALALNLYTWPQDTTGKILTSSLKAQIGLGRSFDLVDSETVPEATSTLSNITEQSSATWTALKLGLTLNANKSSLSTLFYQEIFGDMLELLLQIGDLDEITIEEVFAAAIPNTGVAEIKDMTLLLHHTAMHEVLWQLIQKGRMELRVWAAKYYSDDLVQLYNERRKVTHELKRDLILRVLAQRLEQAKVLEYLVGVDSHPQLVSRSGNIVAFLVACGQWQNYMVDLICNAIASSQDGRIKSAVIDMISVQPVDCMSREELFYLCEKLSHVPYTVLDGETIECICKLARRASDSNAPPSDEDAFSMALTVCRRVLRCSFSGHDADHIQALGKTIGLVQNVAVVHDYPDDRFKIYAECVDDIRNADKASAGSMHLMFALLTSHTKTDIVRVFDDFSLSTLVAENICTFVAQPDRSGSSEELTWQALDIRLRFLSLCIEFDTEFKIGDELETRLWHSIVGRLSLSDTYRNLAWCYLGDLVVKMKQPNQLLNRCMDLHMSGLEPDVLTESALRFVEQSIAYKVRVETPQPDNVGIIRIPLRDFLWHALLKAKGTVPLVAMRILSHNYLTTDFIRNSSLECIAATHTDFVETCIKHLQDAASNLGPPSEQISTATEQSADQFNRSLELLGTFLAYVRSNPEFNKLQSQSPSPVDQVLTNDCGEILSIKFQAYGSDGKDKGVKELMIGSLTTPSVLREELCRKTGFPDISIIYRGTRLELTDSALKNIEQFADGGLLLVRHVGSSDGSTARRLSTFANSVAEGTVLRHMDTFYSFLQLPCGISRAVRLFMLQFPSHPRAQEIVSHVEADRTNLLFPPLHPDLALYNLDALKKQLAKATRVGVVEESWIAQAVEVLCEAVVRLPPLQEQEFNLTKFDVAYWTVSTLIVFLKERLETPLNNSLGDGEALLERLVSFMTPQLGGNYPHLCMQSYVAVLEASLHSKETWGFFKKRNDIMPLHESMLLQYADSSMNVQAVVSIIGDICSGVVKSKSNLTAEDFQDFYWHIIRAALPKALNFPSQCGYFFDLASTVFAAVAQRSTESDLRQTFELWGDVLLQHDHHEIPGKGDINYFVLGMTKLLSLCARYLRDNKTPVGNAEIMAKIFLKFLFPPLVNETARNDTHPDAMPVLDSSTRKELYNLVASLCEDGERFDTICAFLTTLAYDEDAQDPLPSFCDHQTMLRASAGFVGLRNLTNTCYMNSLMTQLFMNEGFRDFFIKAGFIDGSDDHKLLSATKQLFTRMQNSCGKFEDTESFTTAIQPYDAPHIDVTIQMDVDEFYNLLFDRWESQLPDQDTRKKFRSFYGGQLVTQIKSLDCEHVSERLEDCFAIQCEVKGKTNLTESLKSYVQGDVMEGDNKYKCESCGGRFVNAIKRSCLKEIPDNLIFHLKRFDFDLISMQRSKINDRFEFPPTLDMNPYNVAHIDGSSNAPDADIFELTGVLVHNGTAETGHYYSYIRDERKASPDEQHSWLEFNDTLVDGYDPNKLASDSFGGDIVENNGEWSWPKPNSAYMLFYKRRNPRRPSSEAMVEAGGQLATVWQEGTQRDILRDNAVLLRRVCQINPVHSQFLQSLLIKLKGLNGEVCSDTHQAETQLIVAVTRYLYHFGSHNRELDEFECTLQNLYKHVSPCAKCCMSALDCFVDDKLALIYLLVHNGNTRVRIATGRFLSSLVSGIRGRHPHIFGVKSDPSSSDDLTEWDENGAFPRLSMALAELMTSIGRCYRSWGEYWDLLAHLSSMGIGEAAVLLDQGIFLDICLLLAVPAEMRLPSSRRHDPNFTILTRAKKVDWSPLVRPLSNLFQYINPFEPSISNAEDRNQFFVWQTKKFPMSDLEYEIFTTYSPTAQDRGYILVGKVLDLYDWDDPDITPQLSIIESFARLTGVDGSDMQLIASTLAANIREWHPWAAGPALQLASTFCRYVAPTKALRVIIQAAAENGSTIHQHHKTSDAADKGGSLHLNFFAQLASVDDSVYSEDPQLLQCMTLDVIHEWMPQLLFCDAPTTRRDALKWLERIIFARFPRLGEDEAPTELDTARAEAVRKLCNMCFTYIESASIARKPLMKVAYLVNVVESCVEWTQRLLDASKQGNNGYKLLENGDEDSEILRMSAAFSRLKFSNSEVDETVGDDAFATETDENLDSVDEDDEGLQVD